MKSYEDGQVEVTRVSRCLYDDNITRLSKYVTRLLLNPSNNHLEAILYGEDVTRTQEAYETQVSIVQTLSSNYLNVYLINPREKTLSVIKQEDHDVPDPDKNTAIHTPMIFSSQTISGSMYIRMTVQCWKNHWNWIM